MNVKRLTSSVAAMALSVSAFASNELEGTFNVYKNAKLSGELRLGYINQNAGDSSVDAHNIASGGHIKLETGKIAGVSAGAAVYTTHRLAKNSAQDADTALFNQADGNSYTLLGQAYLKAQINNTTFVAGRQQIDTPFADSDDIRMIPNLFEAYVVTNTDIKDTTLIAAQVQKWAGVDAPTQDRFEDLHGAGEGTTLLALIYSGMKDSEFSAWYYNVNELTKLFYLEGSSEYPLSDNFLLSLGAQYGNFSEERSSAVDGSFYGLSVDLGLKSFGMNFMAAYNSTSNDNGKAVINGFGGGPYLTSMDEMTIDGLNDAKAYMIGFSKGYGDFGFSYSYGNFQEDSSKTEVDEHNFVAEYSYSDALNFLFMYTDFQAKTATGLDDKAGSFDRVQFYTYYNF